MVFSSMTFLTCALPAAVAMYFLLPGRTLKNAWLVAFSLFFYAWGEPAFLPLMLLSIGFNYACGRLLDRPEGPARRAWLALGLLVNLGTLFCFKYMGWITGLAARIWPGFAAVRAPALPIGISFYTFQAMSYLIDVYRGDSPPQRHLGRLALYIGFFPQLIAGPILRYGDVEGQIRDRRESFDGFWRGLRRFVVGLAKKALLANAVAAVADEAFSTSGLAVHCAWLGALAYALQILFDFSGYSDMAIGLGLMFGFRFPENFNAPYTAVTPRDFWRRWHISLSTWFRDYVYIPLGGSRRGRGRRMLNLMIVFAATGLWHGAGGTFLVWGLYHGALCALEAATGLRPSERALPRAIQHIVTLLLVLVGWVFFRAESLPAALGVLRGMVSGGGRLLYSLTPRAICAMTVGCAVASGLPRRALDAMGEGARERLALICVPALLALCLMALASGAYNPFIYFRF